MNKNWVGTRMLSIYIGGNLVQYICFIFHIIVDNVIDVDNVVDKLSHEPVLALISG